MAREINRNSKLEAINGLEWTGQLLNQEKTSPPTCASEQTQESSSSTNRKIEQLGGQPPINYSWAWKKTRDKKTTRVATGAKTPKRPNDIRWQIKKEKRNQEQLLAKYGEFGARTGTRCGKYWDCRLDFDFNKEGTNQALGKNRKQAFKIIMTQFFRTKWDDTQHGSHVNLLLEERPSNGRIMTQTKWGRISQIGEILSKGRQARETHKTEQGEGKWAIKAKNIQQVEAIFKKFFFTFKMTEASKEKQPQISNEKTCSNIKPSESEKTQQIISQFTAERVKVKRIRPLPNRERKNPLYKMKYQWGDKVRYCLVDTHYQGRTPPSIIHDIFPGATLNLLINRGRKHHFLNKIIKIW